MTLAELQRAFESKRRVTDTQAKERAMYDYILGDLIGRSVARIFNQDNSYPKVYDAYPSIFDKEEMERAEQRKRDELSALKLKEFAESFNKKFKKKEGKLE